MGRSTPISWCAPAAAPASSAGCPWSAPWFIGLSVVLLLCGVASTTSEAFWTNEYRSTAEDLSVVLVQVVGLVGVSAVALWCARAVVRLPLRHTDDVDQYLDDAFRQLSIVTCLASSMLLSLSATGSALSSFIAWRGWYAAPIVIIAVGLMLVLWGAIRHPFAATFGPRLYEEQERAAQPTRAGPTGSTSRPAPAGSVDQS
ncbi:hypothetical protein BH10ACT3_BH10ACT3_17680 [soil metagenome]